MSAPLLEVRGIKKHFPVIKGFFSGQVAGWVKAVDGVDFVVKDGNTLGVVGESGCGKTTTAKLILLLEEKTDGMLFFEGVDVHSCSRAQIKHYRASTQAVFQDPTSSLNPRMRVGDIVAEPIRLHGGFSRKAIREKVEAVLAQVGLSAEAISLYPHEFSGGQRQRIAIARALALDARLIVLDEPVSALDVSIRAQIMNLLRDLQQRLGVAYLLIAHNLETVRYMSNWVVVMYLGKIVESGECEQLYSHPLHPYTQLLFAAALPSHPRDRKDESFPLGEVPSAFNPPTGCHYHPRCPHASRVCREESPLLREQTPQHSVACHLYSK